METDEPDDLAHLYQKAEAALLKAIIANAQAAEDAAGRHIADSGRAKETAELAAALASCRNVARA